jgi:DNA polymerase III subunit epsilon
VSHLSHQATLGDLRDLGTPLYSTTFVALDLETTGGSPTVDVITEVGALKSTGGQITGTFHTLVSPGRSIPAAIQLRTGIGEHTVAGAPSIEAVLPMLWEFLRGTVLVAHNARFDASFLAAAFARHGYALPFRRTVDTLRLARRLLAGETLDLRLQTLARYLGASAEPCHRALPDASATLDIFHRLLELAGPLGVLTCEDLLMFGRTGRAPDLARMKMAAGIPAVAGVYLFVDRHDRVLFVGRAHNLRTRVRSCFYGDNRRGVTTMGDLMRQVVAVRIERCATALESEIRQLRLIHLHQPPFNRRGRRPPAPAWVRILPDRVARLGVVRSPAHAPSALLGPFPSQRAAREVLEAIRDAVPVARCSDPLRHPSGCAFGETGRCMAPCLPERRPGHDGLLAWVEGAVAGGGAALLEELDARMAAGAEMQRNDLRSDADAMGAVAPDGEAAAVFQRSVLLARALERRRVARMLTAAGDLLVCVPNATLRGRSEPALECAAIRNGRLVRSWVQPASDTVGAQQAFESLAPEATGDPGDLEEPMIVWRFLGRAAREGGWVASCTGDLSSRISDRPAVERLAAGRLHQVTG